MTPSAPTPGSFSERDFRDTLGRFATGVAIMTTVERDVPHGMTASAVASVSLAPYLVLVCVERTAIMHDLVQRTGAFALTWLAADQEHLSRRFAVPDRPQGSEQFDGVDTLTDVTGAPIISGGVGHVECTLWAAYDGGDHTIVCGEVIRLGWRSGVPPLLYFASSYHPLPIEPGSGGAG